MQMLMRCAAGFLETVTLQKLGKSSQPMVHYHFNIQKVPTWRLHLHNMFTDVLCSGLIKQ